MPSDRSNPLAEFVRGPPPITERAQAAARRGIAKARAALEALDRNQPTEDDT